MKELGVGMVRRLKRTGSAACGWGGIIVCAAMLAGWFLSGWQSIRWDTSRFAGSGVSSLGFELAEGGVRLHRWVDPKGMSGWPGFHGWRRERVQDAPRWRFWYDHRNIFPNQTFSTKKWFFPLWMPLLLLGAPTLMIWRRRATFSKPGCCRCGYARAGLAEHAPCPECARSFAREDEVTA